MQDDTHGAPPRKPSTGSTGFKGFKGMVSNFQATVAKIGTHNDRPVGLGLAHGSMYTLVYRPPKPDDQQPHAQDELYVVMQGRGTLVVEDERHPFATGDMLFVPALAVHRFEDATDDLLLWAIFWGPEGGESSVQVPCH